VGQSFEYIGEEGELAQVISVHPVSTDERQSIRFRIVRSSSFCLYLGLGNASRLNKSHSAMSKDASTVSFHPKGRSRFHVLTESQKPTYLPVMREGDVVELVVAYQQQEIQWLCNGVEMGVTSVNFNH
jgi:hypothetical protein